MFHKNHLKLQLTVSTLIIAGLLFIWYFFQWQQHHFYNRDALHGKFIAQNKFLLGINYPWLNYGTDFGTNNWGHSGLSEPNQRAQLDHDFSDLQQHGFRVVRWFLFCDGRSGIQTNPDGTVKGIDPYVFKDLDVAVQMAYKHHIMIVFVLFDFSLVQPVATGADSGSAPVQMGGHPDFVSKPCIRQTLLDNVVKPVLQRYGKNGAIVSWEVINEPEWVMRTPGSHAHEIAEPDMVEFVRQVAQLVHQNTAQAVTLGSANRKWLHLWTNVGLDYFQFHHYPSMEWSQPYNLPAAALGLDKPVLIGEFPSQGSKRSVSSYLDLALQNGYAGAFPWSYRAQDKYSNGQSARDQVSQWIAQHKVALAGN
jgi:hypothetical protein